MYSDINTKLHQLYEKLISIFGGGCQELTTRENKDQKKISAVKKKMKDDVLKNILWAKIYFT